ncbi:homoserine kinase [Undibacterium fentianense]|uniref:Homoserine kinase n=1 Tax=Undibacterium fentianense TaxID=2828728 RepID=A0A941E146_9BURK|nr:homoserine kinase [Undibacterium fentianense]MBR7799446.1 homoserine kinase [Undibacterium fentianense]
MAVFTSVTLEDLNAWMPQFPLGKAQNIRGIASGIENSNFFIETEQGEYVLTIFENLNFQQLPFYLKLMRHLADKGILVPAPVANAEGELCVALHGKPAAIVSKLEGSSQMHPQAQHCAEVGTMLARMHLAGQDFSIQQPNLRSLEWWQATVPSVLEFLDSANRQLMQDEITFQTDFAATANYQSLTKGPVHADLFRNNVMFDGERLTGFFDFYFAGCDAWLFDVAVTVNDWCIDLTTGELDWVRVNTMLAAYHAVRPFTSAESAAWRPMLRAAAFRFWLSRVFDYYKPRDAEMLTPHDPTHFERILRLRIHQDLPALPQLTEV